MDFLKIVSSQIKNQKDIINEFNFISSTFYAINNDDCTINIPELTLKAFLFKINHNKSTFDVLKEQFLSTIINNDQQIIDIYQSTPTELVLSAYFHYLKKNINQQELFNFIQVIISHNNPIDFLKKFTFVSDYDMHLFVISFIENSKFEINANNIESNFYKKTIDSFKKYKENKTMVEIFNNILYTYIDNQMFKSAQLFADKFSNNLKLFTFNSIKHTLNLLKKNNIFKNNFSIFSILSFLNNSYLFYPHLKLTYKHLKEYYFSNTVSSLKLLSWDHQEKFNFTKPNNKFLEDNLYAIYKNILFKKMISNKKLNVIEINLLMQIYCLCNNLFSLEEQSFILMYVKNSPLFKKIILNKDNLLIVFLFFSFHNNFDHFEYIIKDNIDIIKSIITINYEHLNKNVYNILIKYSSLDLISNEFKTFLNSPIIIYYFKEQLELLNKNKKNKFYFFANQTFDINLDLFNSLIDEENKAIFEEIYIKKTIANF